MTRRGRTYTPQATLEYEQHVRDSYDGPLHEGPVQLHVELSPTQTLVTIEDAAWSSPLRGDIDNYLKSLLDGLQSVAFNNDRQVVFVTVDKQ